MAVDLHPKLIHYPRIFASNFDPCSCRQAPSLLYQAGLAITASPGSNLNANQHSVQFNTPEVLEEVEGKSFVFEFYEALKSYEVLPKYRESVYI